MTGDEALLAELRQGFPLWQIWYVPSSGRGGTWCANPWAKEKDRTGVLHAYEAEHLADYIREYEREHTGQCITGPAEVPGDRGGG